MSDGYANLCRVVRDVAAVRLSVRSYATATEATAASHDRITDAFPISYTTPIAFVGGGGSFLFGLTIMQLDHVSELEDFGLDTNSINRLEENGIQRIDMLLQLTRDGLIEIDNMGEKRADYVIQATRGYLAAKGYELPPTGGE